MSISDKQIKHLIGAFFVYFFKFGADTLKKDSLAVRIGMPIPTSNKKGGIDVPKNRYFESKARRRTFCVRRTSRDFPKRTV